MSTASEAAGHLESFAVQFVWTRTGWLSRWVFFWVWLRRREQAIAAVEIMVNGRTKRAVSESFVNAVHAGDWHKYREWLPDMFVEVRPLLIQR